MGNRRVGNLRINGMLWQRAQEGGVEAMLGRAMSSRFSFLLLNLLRPSRLAASLFLEV